jgi:prophage antirepressor-like protein
MSSEIKIFDFDGYNKIRGVFYLGKPWFVAEDICRLLDVGNTRSTLVLLDEEDKGIHLIDDKFGRQELPVITEAGVYSIIFGRDTLALGRSSGG